jgi:signal transduction histidine kinase
MAGLGQRIKAKWDKLNTERLIRLIHIVVIVVMVLIEAIIIGQYSLLPNLQNRVLPLLMVILLCVLLTVSIILTAFVITNFKVRVGFFTLDVVLLLIISCVTGNTYLSTLYCVILTQVYLLSEKFKYSIAMFGTGCALFVVSFVIGWVFAHRGATDYETTVEILSGCLNGLLLMSFHFLIVNFSVTAYRNNKRLTAALQEAEYSRDELSKAYNKLAETAVFQERNRIAKDIHDNAGHSMTTVIMQTEAAKLLIDTNPEEAKNSIISANIQARNALEQMRESVHLLAGRTSGLSLREEIEEIIAQTMDGTNLKVRYDLDDIALSEEKSRFVCNSVKECLANGIRHGKATAFYVEMKKEGNMASIFISDNGSGMEGEVVYGFGLRVMKEKCEGFGGSLSITSEAGEGCEVEIQLPITETNGAAK